MGNIYQFFTKSDAVSSKLQEYFQIENFVFTENEEICEKLKPQVQTNRKCHEYIRFFLSFLKQVRNSC